MNNLVLQVKRLCDVGYQQLAQFMRWSCNPINGADQSKQIAMASSPSGETLVAVPFEKVLLVSDYIVSPQVNSKQASTIGDELDMHLAQEAMRVGCQKILMCLPNTPENREAFGECRSVLIYERSVPQLPAVFFSETQAVSHYIN